MGGPLGGFFMKKWIGIALCLVPLAAHAQQRYTNEDLKKFTVPGAYTNQDLKKMAPVPVVRGAAVSVIPAPPAPAEAEALQIRFGLLSEQRLILQTEMDWRQAMIRKADSAFDKGTDGYPWPGYRSKNREAIQSLEMRLAVVEARLEEVRDEARRADVLLESR
jgi:hypothetical protein